MVLVGLLVGNDGAGLGLVNQVVGQLPCVSNAHLERGGLGVLVGSDDPDDLQVHGLVGYLGHFVRVVADVAVVAVITLDVLVCGRHHAELLLHDLGVVNGGGVGFDLLAAVELAHDVGVLVGGQDAKFVEAGDGDLVVLVQHQNDLILGLGPGTVNYLVVVGHHLADGGLGICTGHDLPEDLRSLVLVGLAGQVRHLHGLDVAHIAVRVGGGHLTGCGAGVLRTHGHLVGGDQLALGIMPEDSELGVVGVLNAHRPYVLVNLALGVVQVLLEACQVVLGDAAGQARGPLDAGIIGVYGLEVLVGLGLLFGFLGRVHDLVQVEGLLLDRDGVGGHGLTLDVVDVPVHAGGYGQDQRYADDAD